jgi:hypothetical protein
VIDEACEGGLLNRGERSMLAVVFVPRPLTQSFCSGPEQGPEAGGLGSPEGALAHYTLKQLRPGACGLIRRLLWSLGQWIRRATVPLVGVKLPLASGKPLSRRQLPLAMHKLQHLSPGDRANG